MYFLRRQRQRIGRLLVSVLTLAWMTLALQPCATAQEHADPHTMHETAHAVSDHGMHGPAMDHAGMDHGAAHAMAGSPAADPCPPGAECPVFKAVADQASTKAADPHDLPLQPAPAFIASWRVPLFAEVRSAFDARTALAPVPEPPILAFRVLRI